MVRSTWKARRCIRRATVATRACAIPDSITELLRTVHIAARSIAILNSIMETALLPDAFRSTTKIRIAALFPGVVVSNFIVQICITIDITSSHFVPNHFIYLQPNQVIPLWRNFAVRRNRQIRKWLANSVNLRSKLATNWIRNKKTYRARVQCRHNRIAFKKRIRLMRRYSVCIQWVRFYFVVACVWCKMLVNKIWKTNKYSHLVKWDWREAFNGSIG